MDPEEVLDLLEELNAMLERGAVMDAMDRIREVADELEEEIEGEEEDQQDDDEEGDQEAGEVEEEQPDEVEEESIWR